MATTDEHAQYKNSILKVYGQESPPSPEKKGNRKRKPKLVPPPGLVYATVDKTRENGEIVHVETTLVFGTPEELASALDRSPCSSNVNTSFVERQNGTARHFNPRKQRKTYSFSKQLLEHFAMTWLAAFFYNFCRPNRMLRVPVSEGVYVPRSPAMVADIADHIWTIEEFLAWQVLGGA